MLNLSFGGGWTLAPLALVTRRPRLFVTSLLHLANSCATIDVNCCPRFRTGVELTSSLRSSSRHSWSTMTTDCCLFSSKSITIKPLYFLTVTQLTWELKSIFQEIIEAKTWSLVALLNTIKMWYRCGYQNNFTNLTFNNLLSGKYNK